MLDGLIVEFDRALRAVAAETRSRRPNPSHTLTPEPDLHDVDERQKSARLMRVNHVGEICAQALYQGQRLCASDPEMRQQLQRAGAEEEDHLAWCAARLKELEARPSLLNPLWYSGSFAMGVLAGAAGDRLSMGFLVETEHQVERHLDRHLDSLPAGDARSRAILTQMRADEIAHAAAAQAQGAQVLPAPLPTLMRAASKIMTATAYYL